MTFALYSSLFEERPRVVRWLVSKSLNAACSFVFVAPVDRLCIRHNGLRLTEVYAPNIDWERPDFFRRTEPFLITSSTAVVLESDRDSVFDPDIDLLGE